ncbi:MSMEG_4193 family putative phosphomutase [Gryllotalpicola reticulitermitis]|uniref:MSMEG_4193 family putative phosphomutase n=1 Tax=Gryllotalpicola reticulitermitis TaxID=1184153 RepID=A0ABV8QCZ6_9MICO
MSTVLLVRHGRTAANARGVLAGRTAGVALDEVGRQQVARTAERLASIDLAAVVSSPLQRCRQTARAIVERQSGAPATPIDRGLTEADYGEWQGRALTELARESLWSAVQNQPSTAVFPGGESMAAMQARALAAVHRYDVLFGPDAVWAAVTHADIIKSVLADARGMHFDQFQRIAVAPASVSIVRYDEGGAQLIADAELETLSTPGRR